MHEELLWTLADGTPQDQGEVTRKVVRNRENNGDPKKKTQENITRIVFTLIKIMDKLTILSL